MSVRNLEPKEMWNHFADLNAVPRPSKKEEKVIEFMMNFGKSLDLETLQDKIGNVIIKKPATSGMEDRKAIVMQSHLDMVHQKNSDTDFDFLTQGNCILVPGDLEPVHASAANQWLLKESQWFNINPDIAGRAMKDVFKHYKKYLEKSRKNTQYLKDNWSFDKMTEKLNSFLPKVEAAPQTQTLKLPKLKKVGAKTELPKLKLPKLKKIEA